MATGQGVSAAVAGLFDRATREEAATLDGLLRALERARGRRILIDREASLPVGMCGRWIALQDRDLLQLQQHGPSPEWTTMHELGHMVLQHRGHPVTEIAHGAATAAESSMIEYMLARGGQALSESETRQEDEAEAFAGLLSVRLRQAARSAAPAVQARLDETLG